MLQKTNEPLLCDVFDCLQCANLERTGNSVPIEMTGHTKSPIFNLHPPGSENAVAGLCHTRGPNAGLPAQWLLYVRVANVEESVTHCLANGGAVVDGPRPMGPLSFCVIRDPAGAVLALISS